MKYFILILFLFSSVVSCLNASTTDVRTALYLSNAIDQKFTRLMFGIDTGATMGFDTLLEGGQPLPPFPPLIGNLGGYFILPDSVSDWSYIDFRSFPKNDTTPVIYKLNLYNNLVDTTIISWNPIDPNLIDSAWIIDRPGPLVFINMMDSTKAKLPDQYINEFWIKVWYKSTILAVKESPGSGNIIGHINLLPNPAGDFINIESDKIILSCKIISLLGEEIFNGSLANNRNNLDVHKLNRGIYMLEAITADGEVMISKFIKN